MTGDPKQTIAIPRLIHEYAQVWHVWMNEGVRNSDPYSLRTRYGTMSRDQVSAELDRLKYDIISLYGYEPATPVKPETAE